MRMPKAIVFSAAALASCANAEPTIGPVLQVGRWHATVNDDHMRTLATASMDVDLSGNAPLVLSGMFPDGGVAFAISAMPALRNQGVNFTVTGSSGDQPVAGFGRVSVSSGLLAAVIPSDSQPDHALLIGQTAWQFHLLGSATASHLEGTWMAQSADQGFVEGTFSADPGPPELADAAPAAEPAGLAKSGRLP